MWREFFSLHGTRVANNNLVVIRLIAIYVLLDGNTDNGEQQIRK